MNIINFNEEAFCEIIEKLLNKVNPSSHNIKSKWISSSEAMELLSIKSKTTLQSLRDKGKIRFSQPNRKIILYDRESIEAFIEQHVRNIF
ncbi:DNA-binding protein [Chitinophagaceae bacterium IBVUCB1]|nr:DNA-binding protein [Chitinophagaceae bacterium IBVUCB1]